MPSYATVYAVVRGIDPAMRTLALDGEKRYREVFDLIHCREAASPNEIWQADHTQTEAAPPAPCPCARNPSSSRSPGPPGSVGTSR